MLWLLLLPVACHGSFETLVLRSDDYCPLVQTWRSQENIRDNLAQWANRRALHGTREPITERNVRDYLTQWRANRRPNRRALRGTPRVPIIPRGRRLSDHRTVASSPTNASILGYVLLASREGDMLVSSAPVAETGTFVGLLLPSGAPPLSYVSMGAWRGLWIGPNTTLVVDPTTAKGKCLPSDYDFCAHIHDAGQPRWYLQRSTGKARHHRDGRDNCTTTTTTTDTNMEKPTTTTDRTNEIGTTTTDTPLGKPTTTSTTDTMEKPTTTPTTNDTNMEKPTTTTDTPLGKPTSTPTITTTKEKSNTTEQQVSDFIDPNSLSDSMFTGIIAAVCSVIALLLIIGIVVYCVMRPRQKASPPNPKLPSSAAIIPNANVAALIDLSSPNPDPESAAPPATGDGPSASTVADDAGDTLAAVDEPRITAAIAAAVAADSDGRVRGDPETQKLLTLDVVDDPRMTATIASPPAVASTTAVAADSAEHNGNGESACGTPSTGGGSGETFGCNSTPVSSALALFQFRPEPVLRPPEPEAQRTFETSNFLVLWKMPTECDVYMLLRAVEELIKLHLERVGARHLWAQCFVREMNKAKKLKAFKDDDVGSIAEYMWSSFQKFQGTELCGILQTAIRNDDPSTIVFAVVFARAITMNLLSSRQPINAPKWMRKMFDNGVPYPHKLEGDDKAFAGQGCASWRGGGFEDKYKSFFTVGKTYRVPAFLATSLSKKTAQNFIGFKYQNNKSRLLPRVLWTVKVDKKGKKDPKFRCKHASFIVNTQVEGEGEFLFAAYSAFTVVCADFSPKDWSKASSFYRIVIEAVTDNKTEDNGLELAPWY